LLIPLSVLAAIAGLYVTGNTINVMTLAGLSLAIGPLVDLAVICLESTHRHLKRGAAPGAAALAGTSEVAKPALTATCCTLLVLAPLSFLPDLGEFLFRPMALAVAFAMVAALALSLTFVPSRCAAWLKPEAEGGRQEPVGSRSPSADSRPPSAFSRLLTAYCVRPTACLFACWESFFYRASRSYERLLEQFLNRRRFVLCGAAGLLIVTLAVLGPRLKREFFPDVDAGAFELTLRAPSGTRLEVTEQRVAQVEELIRDCVGDDLALIVSEAGVVADWSAAYTPNAGPMDALVKVQLTADRRHSAQEHVRSLRRRLRQDERLRDLEFGFDAGGMIRSAMNGGKSTPLNIRVTGKDLPRLRGIAEAIQARLATVEGVVDARILQRLDYPQYVIDIDRERAADLGLPLPYVVKNVVAALNSSIQFNKRNFYIDPVSNGQYYVGVQYPESDIESIETLLNVPITSPAQQRAIPLRNLVTWRRASVPTEVVHNELATSVELVMAVEGRDLGHVAEDVTAALEDFGARQADGTWVPYAGARIELSGEYARMQDMFRNLGGGFLLATLLVYLLLVTLFQSFRLPLAILAAVPLGLIGVVLMLFATGTAVNVQSLLGVVFMVGIVVANTVLLVESAEALRTGESLSPRDAIRLAAAIRMRPVLMTALAALLALLPMALALSRGSEANAPLGRAVIGGLVASTIVTLFVVPCAYSLIQRRTATDATC
ncbi:MAG: efflux RND transporter permease subunit, partial [Planctomycetes bacterium]|nr:efflux RND transporter permease subunit [Planctomycetota bacterium]